MLKALFGWLFGRRPAPPVGPAARAPASPPPAVPATPTQDDAGFRKLNRDAPLRAGQPAEAPAGEFALGFEGQWRDAETGLHYNRFRYYDPETARYLTPDPYGLFADPNAYRYVPSPLEWVDPYGLDQVTTTVGNRDYVFDRDAQGRTVRAEGPLCNPNRIENEHRSTSAQKRIAGGTGDHAGHLIGNQFGGPGGDENLVRMCPTLNLGKWKKMENQLVGLTKNNSVRVVVTVHYKGNSTKPAKFTVDAYITDRNGKVTRKRWQHKNC